MEIRGVAIIGFTRYQTGENILLSFHPDKLIGGHT
jgi:hypothetical protein